MPLLLVVSAVLIALFTSGVLAKDIDDEVSRHGFQRLPPLSSKKIASRAASHAPAYLKIVQPGRKLSILDLGVKRENPNSIYSIVSFEIDCQKMAMRYRAAQLVDLPWVLKGSNTPVRGPWHSPNKDSVQEQSLLVACKS